MKTKQTLKSYFETGEKPTEQEFADLIDSYHHIDSGAVVTDIAEDQDGNKIISLSDGTFITINVPSASIDQNNTVKIINLDPITISNSGEEEGEFEEGEFEEGSGSISINEAVAEAFNELPESNKTVLETENVIIVVDIEDSSGNNAIHKFLLKSGKGIRTINETDIELINKDVSEELVQLSDRISRFSGEFINLIRRYPFIDSDDRINVINETTDNNTSYKLNYNADDQDIEFRFGSIQRIDNTVRNYYINSGTDNKIKFVTSDNVSEPIELVIPQGKLPYMTGIGKMVHAQMLRTSDSENLVYLSGDLDSIDSEIGAENTIALEPESPNPVVKVWSGTQAQYNAIGTKREDVLYFISEEPINNTDS